jgi:hypothetical protein
LRAKSQTSDYLKCFILNAEKNYPRTPFSNALFTKIDSKCASTLTPTYQDKLNLEKIEEKTKTATDYDSMMAAITSLGLDASPDQFFQCIITETKANYPRTNFTNQLYTPLNAVCDASLTYDDKLKLKKFVTDNDKNSNQYQLIDLLETQSYSSSEFFKCLDAELWKIAPTIKFQTQFETVNQCTTGNVSVTDKKTLYTIYK